MIKAEKLYEHLVPGKQGQLVIKFAEDDHLCKILVENGRAVHLAQGHIQPEEVLKTLPTKTIEWINFIDGFPVRKKLDFPLHENLISEIQQQTSASPQPAESDPGSAAAVDTLGQAVPPEQVQAAIDGFIERVGTLGTIHTILAAKSVNYTTGSLMAASDYASFVQSLAQEISADERDEYLSQCLV